MDNDGPGGSNPPVVTRFVYDGPHIALAFGGTATAPTNRYLHGAAVDQVFADEQISGGSGPGTVYWPTADHLGTVRDLLNDSGAVVKHLVYDSFGKRVTDSAPTLDFLFSFTGREWDPETELYYYRARYYEPTTHLFLSEDPIADDSNPYRYVGNGPTNATDPSGLEQRQGLPTRKWFGRFDGLVRALVPAITYVEGQQAQGAQVVDVGARVVRGDVPGAARSAASYTSAVLPEAGVGPSGLGQLLVGREYDEFLQRLQALDPAAAERGRLTGPNAQRAVAVAVALPALSARSAAPPTTPAAPANSGANPAGDLLRRVQTQRQFTDALKRRYDTVKNDPNLNPLVKQRDLERLDRAIQNAEGNLTRLENELNSLIDQLRNPPPNPPPANP